MTEKTAYAPGEPIWTDLCTPDVAASTAFYGALLGWTAEAPQEQYGGYASWLLGEKKVAGLMPRMSPEQPPTWTVYLCSEDASRSAARVEQAGGTVLTPPMQVGELGTMAVFADDRGAPFGVWQPGTHLGGELVLQDGALTWVELTSEDPAQSGRFYEAVADLTPKPSPDHLELVQGGRSVAGVTGTAQGTPPGWFPYFGVADPAAAARQAEELGGTVVLPCTEFPGGSCSIVRDPHGALLGLITSSGPA